MIKPSDYLIVSNYIGDAYDSLTSSITELRNMRTTLQEMVVGNETARTTLSQFLNQCGSTLVEQQASPSTTLKNAIIALQQHVVNRFGPLNLFLSTSGIKVSPSFALLSGMVGFVINPSNIA